MSEEKQQEEVALAGAESDGDPESNAELDEEELAESLAEDEAIEDDFLSSEAAPAPSEKRPDEGESEWDADAEDGEDDDDESDEDPIPILASDELEAHVAGEASSGLNGAPPGNLLNGASGEEEAEDQDDLQATRDEVKPVVEALLFVADEPLPFKQLCKVLGDIPEEDVKSALDELVADYESRGSGLEVREIAGGWRISTRPQNHEFIRKYLKSRPSARLSLPALETLAVIAYKQPITIPEILEIRGVSSSSAIKTLLEKRLIMTKGRKETVGRPMMYGTSRDFLIQFGLKDLTELPSIEDFEDLAQ
jgi:segregation and condensation protein B